MNCAEKFQQQHIHNIDPENHPKRSVSKDEKKTITGLKKDERSEKVCFYEKSFNLEESAAIEDEQSINSFNYDQKTHSRI